MRRLHVITVEIESRSLSQGTVNSPGIYMATKSVGERVVGDVIGWSEEKVNGDMYQ